MWSCPGCIAYRRESVRLATVGSVHVRCPSAPPSSARTRVFSASSAAAARLDVPGDDLARPTVKAPNVDETTADDRPAWQSALLDYFLQELTVEIHRLPFAASIVATPVEVLRARSVDDLTKPNTALDRVRCKRIVTSRRRDCN